ncbi:N-acyl-D-glucosamine 2-epimerase [Paenibacillus chartarius]|uniref:N-acyl-D-glucosamine 2-epimerase n=1 Tax=Paenibacillus chartarius TaxID=747481 RepID=A0ABV6DVI8_9BACL
MTPSIQIDPSFPYYRQRSPDSIADELQLAGYRAVHIFVTNEFDVDAELVRALHRCRLEVWALTLGNGTFTTAHLPSGWEGWQMGLLKTVNDGYTRLSPFCPAYVAWKKQALAALVRSIPFDGLHIAEPYLPEWGGLKSGTYGDVGAHAAAAFRRTYGAAIPEFRNRLSPRYYRKQPELYEAWVQFRVDGVNDYVDEIFNGCGGVREARPDIRIATWTLAVDDGPDSAAKLRELQGNDAVSMIAKVKPDLHYLQTHWPDWGRAALPAEYVRTYRPFVQAIRDAHPSLPIGIQTDIGSAKPMIRSRAWLEQFARETGALGCSTWTAYEYHIGGALYDEAPRLMGARRLAGGGIELCFHKRIASVHTNSTGSGLQLAARTGNVVRELFPAHVSSDGNRLILRGLDLPSGATHIGVKGTADTPELLLFPPKRANRTSVYEWASLDEHRTVCYTNRK